MINKLTRDICQEWYATNRTKNPLSGKQLDDSLKKIVLKRCDEFLKDPSNSKSTSFSPDALISAAEKHIFKHKISHSKSSTRTPKSSIRTPKSSSRTPKSLSAPNSVEISDMRETLPYLFELSFQDFENMKSDNHRIDAVLLNYDITDPVEIKLIKKFIKYIINIPNAKGKRIKELSEIIQSRKYKKVSFKDLPDDILKQISTKYYDTMIENALHKWIDEKKLNVRNLSSVDHPGIMNILGKEKNRNKIDFKKLSANPNPMAIQLLEEHPDKIYWPNLSGNPSAMKLLKEYQDEIYWTFLSENPNPIVIKFLKANPDEIEWRKLSSNTNSEVIEIFRKNPDKIYDRIVSGNQSLWAIQFLKEYPNKIYWWGLSENPAAIDLLKENPDKIEWNPFSENSHPEAIKLLEENPDKIHWGHLSRNPAAINLLKQNQDKINWEYVSANPGAIKLLEKNQDKIDWDALSSNPAIFRSYRYKNKYI